MHLRVEFWRFGFLNTHDGVIVKVAPPLIKQLLIQPILSPLSLIWGS